MAQNPENTDKPVARYLTVAALAERWSISLPHAYKLAGSVLPRLQIGASVRVPLAAVIRYEREQLGTDAA